MVSVSKKNSGVRQYKEAEVPEMAIMGNKSPVVKVIYQPDSTPNPEETPKDEIAPKTMSSVAPIATE